MVLKIIKADADAGNHGGYRSHTAAALCLSSLSFFVEAKLKSHFDSEGRRIDSFRRAHRLMMIPVGRLEQRRVGRKPGGDEYSDWELWKQKKDAEIARRGENREAEGAAELSIRKRREKAGAVILQRKPRGSSEQENGGETVRAREIRRATESIRRIYDRYRIYRGYCGAGFYGSVGCAPAEKSAGVSARTGCLFARKGRSVMRICGIMQIRFFSYDFGRRVNGGLVSAVFLHRVYDFDRRGRTGRPRRFRFSVFRRRVYCFFIELRIFSSKNVPVSEDEMEDSAEGEDSEISGL